MKKELRTAYTLVMVCLLAMATGAAAQNLTGSISGTVADPTGAVISGATITVTNTEQNVMVRQTTSNSAGDYSVPLLLIGTYSITADASGFEKKTVENVVLNVNDTLSIPIVLALGSVNQSVTVTAATLAPDVVSATASSLINGTQMKQLPLTTRNFEEVLALQPGIAASGLSMEGQYRGITRTNGQNTQSQFSINGGAQTSNGYFLDGADILNHGGAAQVAIFPSVDAVQEQSIVRNAYDASYGGNGAGIVTIQSKSGGNQFHGDAYYFFRNQDLNANDFFNNLSGVPRPTTRYGDFGYTVGGPVWIPKINPISKPRLFFFLSQEFLRDRDTSQSTLTNIPTAAQRAGTFSSPVCVYNTPGTCTLSTQVTKIDSMAQAYLKDVFSVVPVPNSPTDPQGLIAASPGIQNESQVLIRGDYQINDKWSTFVRFVNDPFNLVVPNGLYSASGVPNVGTSATTNGGTNLLLHTTFTMGSHTVIEAGYVWYHVYITSQLIGPLNPENSPDVRPTLPYTPTLAQITGLSFPSDTYNATGPYYDHDDNQQIFVNLTHTVGRQTILAGYYLEPFEEDNTNGILNAGLFTFNAAKPAGSSATAFMQDWANFLQGTSSTFSQNSINAINHSKQTINEFYLQDNAKLTPRLSLTGGVRYSLIGDPTNPQGLLSSFDPNAFVSSAKPTIDSNGLICTTSPCAGGGTPNAAYNAINGFIGPATPVHPYGNKVTTQPALTFAPRLGFAYQLFGNGRTALRGGYGIYYIRQSDYLQNPDFSDPPVVSSISISNASLDSPAAGAATANVPLSAYGFEPNFKQPYSQNWSLDVQQQLMGNSLLDVGYFGNDARHLQVSIDANQPLPGAYVTDGIAAAGGISSGLPTQKLNQIRPYPGYGALSVADEAAVSSYNSLQASFTQRFHGASLANVNYTWSRSLSDNNAPQNHYDLAAEKGPTTYSAANILTGDFVYDLPFFEQQSGLVGHLLGGWELTGIVSVESGQYQTATTTSVDPAGQGLLALGTVGTHRPDQLSNPNSGAPHTRLEWFNNSAFAAVPTSQARPGDASNGSIILPGSQQWNLSLFRDVKFSERVKVELRAESYNTFNHVNWSTVNSVVENTNYGQVTADLAPRTLQLGTKITF